MIILTNNILQAMELIFNKLIKKSQSESIITEKLLAICLELLQQEVGIH